MHSHPQGAHSKGLGCPQDISQSVPTPYTHVGKGEKVPRPENRKPSHPHPKPCLRSGLALGPLGMAFPNFSDGDWSSPPQHPTPSRQAAHTFQRQRKGWPSTSGNRRNRVGPRQGTVQ